MDRAKRVDFYSKDRSAGTVSVSASGGDPVHLGKYTRVQTTDWSFANYIVSNEEESATIDGMPGTGVYGYNADGVAIIEWSFTYS